MSCLLKYTDNKNKKARAKLITVSI